MMFFVVVFLVSGIVLLVAGRNLQAQARRAARWPTVAGTLQRCEVVEKPSIRNESPSSWDLQVEYSCVVHGITYRSTRYAFGFAGGLDDTRYRAAAEKLDALPHVFVHYDPARPAEAVLDTAVPTSIAMMGRFGLAMAAVSALFGLVRICT
jgi:hypothetical protein